MTREQGYDILAALSALAALWTRRVAGLEAHATDLYLAGRRRDAERARSSAAAFGTCAAELIRTISGSEVDDRPPETLRTGEQPQA